MNRRELLVSAGGLVLGSLITNIASAADTAKGKKGVVTDDPSNPHQKLIDAAQVCVARGNACIQHCQTMLSTGDTSMSACLRTALEMVDAAELVGKYAAYRSPSLAKAVALAAEVAAACEKSCREHEKHHKVCKECAECCATFVKECQKVSV